MEDFDMPDLFEPFVSYPDNDTFERFNLLVGIDDIKRDLQKILTILVNPEGIRKWQNEHHPNAKNVLERILRQPPLIVLAGDVGSGKSELANTIGDSVARAEDVSITLLPLSLSARGRGQVGEMTRLISSAFEHVGKEAENRKGGAGAVIFLVDEADALAQSRSEAQMHHEDRAGVNAFIRGIDNIANKSLPAAVIMCTNRPGALDPAIKRRAARIFTFGRPDEEKRKAVLAPLLSEFEFGEADIKKIVAATGGNGKDRLGCTFSDLTQRLIPEIVLDAYPDNEVTPSRALEIAQALQPTPPFKEG